MGREKFQKQVDFIIRVLGWSFLSLIALGAIGGILSAQNILAPYYDCCIEKVEQANKVNLNLPNIRYTVKGKKISGLSVLVIASFVDGAVKGFDFDGRTSFHRKGWTSDPYSFFGSRSHARKKKWIEERAGVFDFYHVADDVRKYGYIGGSALYGIGSTQQNEKAIHWIKDILIIITITSISKRAGMYWIRN